MYDLKSGILIGLHNKVFDAIRDDKAQEVQDMPQITKFCIDKKHRKAYVANNMGQINVINCQNGVVLKEVTLGAAHDHS